jgi:choline dehydrogenase-like flavoprotein
VPLLSLAYARKDEGVMKYSTPHQLYLQRAGDVNDNRPVMMLSGKLLGGTSRINNGLYSRCSPAEFVDWGRGWDYDHLKPLYDRSEKNLSDIEHTNSTGEWKTRIVEPFFESSHV